MNLFYEFEIPRPRAGFLLLLAMVLSSGFSGWFWQLVDPIGYFLFDSNWDLVDAVYSALLIAPLAIFLWRTRHESWPDKKLLLLLGLWLFWATLSVVWTPFFWQSLRDVAVEAWLSFALFLLAFRLAKRGVLTEEMALQVSLALLLLVSLQVYVVGIGMDYNGLEQLDTIALSCWLCLYLPLLLQQGRRWLLAGQWLRLYGMALLYMLLAMGTQQRMFFLALLPLLLFFAWQTRMLFVLPPQRRAWLGWLLLLLLSALFLFYWSAAVKPANWLPKYSNAQLGFWNVFVKSDRFEIWRFWLDKVANNPWTGLGYGWPVPGNFYKSVRPQELPSIMFSHGHNLLLNKLLQLGILGLLLFCSVMAQLGWQGWQAWRHRQNGWGLALLLMVLFMLLRNMTDDGFRGHNVLLFWILAGVMLAWLPQMTSGHAEAKLA